MVVVAGDQQGKLKVDDQVIAAVVDTAVERGASRVVLVTPLGGGGFGGSSGNGGLFGSLFGGGAPAAGPAAASRGSGQLRLSRSEQKVQVLRCAWPAPNKEHKHLPLLPAMFGCCSLLKCGVDLRVPRRCLTSSCLGSRWRSLLGTVPLCSVRLTVLS